VIVLGALGGVFIWLGEQLHGRSHALSSANFVETIAQLVDFTIEWVAALGGAVIIGSFARRGRESAADGARAAEQHPRRGAGRAERGDLLGFTAYIGTQAVQLGLLTADRGGGAGRAGDGAGLRAASAGPRSMLRRRRREDVSAEQAARSTLFIIGAVLTFLVAAYVLDLLRAIVDERPPSGRLMDWACSACACTSRRRR